MLSLGNIFSCCKNSIKQRELAIEHPIRRNYSCQEPPKKLYIKRSIGKNPIIDLSAASSLNSSFKTPKEQNSIQIKLFGDRNGYLQSNNHHLLQYPPFSQLNNFYRNQNSQIGTDVFASRNSGRKSIEKFINYTDLSPTKRQLISSQPIQHHHQPIDLKLAYQIPSYTQRLAQNKGYQPNKTQTCVKIVYVSNQKTKTFNNKGSNQPPQVLQTIEEKSSLPSCSESLNKNFNRQISSKPIVHYNYQKTNLIHPSTKDISIQQLYPLQPSTSQASNIKTDQQWPYSQQLKSQKGNKAEPKLIHYSKIQQQLEVRQQQRRNSKQKLQQQLRTLQKNTKELYPNAELKDKLLKEMRTSVSNKLLSYQV